MFTFFVSSFTVFSVMVAQTVFADSVRLAQLGTTATVQIISSTSTAIIRWAVPEMRVGLPGTNDDALFFLTARSLGEAQFTTPIIASTTIDGRYTTPIPLGAVDGLYDIGIKTHQHLTKVLRNVPLDGTERVLNFTQQDYSVPVKGLEVLVAGDINGLMTIPSQMGDDKINAIDVTSLLAQFNVQEKYARPNLNQDGKVNALDMTIILKNFNRLGDR